MKTPSGQRKGKRTREERGVQCAAFFCKNIGQPNQSLSGGYWEDFPDGRQKVTHIFGQEENKNP